MDGSPCADLRRCLTSATSVLTTARSAPFSRMCRVRARVSTPVTASTPCSASQSSHVWRDARLKR